ncbi:hypothetical protein GCM10023166_19260 [Paeniglutamicibacter cryotolerans]|uniref:Uncharacterized protein n=1 Tax=Paeniglutamicibacter cryotolerans TaxID=670079 RepID=A0A839QLB6_9MICC|nr:hypothetical protein [Paeniglutamicibacter cryotolerans]
MFVPAIILITLARVFHACGTLLKSRITASGAGHCRGLGAGFTAIMAVTGAVAWLLVVPDLAWVIVIR